jgi:hypothetical protein
MLTYNDLQEENKLDPRTILFLGEEIKRAWDDAVVFLTAAVL